MKGAPIPLALDLWSLGHSGTAIARMLGFPNRRHVERIVAQARALRDKRAVLHVAGNGYLVGRPGRMERPPVAIPVPLIGKPQCVRGHARIPENLGFADQCLLCRRVRHAERKARSR